MDIPIIEPIDHICDNGEWYSPLSSDAPEDEELRCSECGKLLRLPGQVKESSLGEFLNM